MNAQRIYPKHIFFRALLGFLTGLIMALAGAQAAVSKEALDKGDTALVSEYSNKALGFIPQAPDSANYWYNKATTQLGNGLWPGSYLNLLLKLKQMYEDRSENESALKYTHQILDNYPSHRNGVVQLSATASYAMMYGLKGDTEEAFKILRRQKVFLDSCLRTGGEQYCDLHVQYYTNTGICYAISEQPTLALREFLRGDSILQHCGSMRMKAEVNYCLGSIFSELNEPEHAKSCFKELEGWFDRGEVEYIMTPAYDNMVVLYLQLAQYDSARIYLKKGLDFSRKMGDSISVAYNFMYAADIDWDEKKYLSAEKNFHISIDKFKESGFEMMYHDVQYRRISSALEGGIAIPNMGELIEQTLAYFKEAGLTYKTSLIYRQSALFKFKQGDFKNSYLDLVQYDSLNTVYQEGNQKEVIASMQTKYDTDLHKREAEKQAALAMASIKESKVKSEIVWILAIALFALLSVFIVLFRLYQKLGSSRRVVAEQKAGIEKKEKEKSVLLKELHHRVKNNLQIVSSLLNLQKENAKDEAAKGAFKEGQNRVEAMALIHRYLYATDELTKLELDKYLKQLVQSIAFSYGYHKNEVKLNFDISEIPVDVDLAIPLGLIANELVSNVFKHAFKGDSAPELSIRLKNEQGLILEIADNGPGIPDFDHAQEGSSFGMDLVHSLCSQLKAELSYQFNEGAVIRLKIQEKDQNTDITRHEDTAA